MHKCQKNIPLKYIFIEFTAPADVKCTLRFIQSWWLSRMRVRLARSPRARHHSFVEIDHVIFSMVILSLPLIQEGQLSASGERMCTILVNRLENKACPVKVWLGKLTTLDMTLID